MAVDCGLELRQQGVAFVSLWPGAVKTEKLMYNFQTDKYGENQVAAVKEGKEMFYLTTHSTHFIYGYMASDIW